jgi:glycosyltransferase involved in cell wall biosynthesis
MTGPVATARRLLTLMDDRVRRSDAIADAMARLNLLLHRSGRRIDGRRNTVPPPTLQRALRLARTSAALRGGRRALEAWLDETGEASPAGAPRDRLELVSSIVAKSPQSGGEKGVLFLGTERDLDLLATSGLLPDVQQEFTLFSLSAWSPPSPRTYAGVARACVEPVHVGISHADDVSALAVYGQRIVPVPLMACDWINPMDFTSPPAATRDIDVIMVASWERFKRHWLLFRALRHLPPQLRVVLVGTSSGKRSVDDVKEDARTWGVRQPLEFHNDVSIAEVNRLQSAARVALQCSGREGSCVAVTEAMMAGTPVGVPSDSHFGARRHINARTGRVLERDVIGRELGRLLDDAHRLDPRGWIVENASCITSSARLDAHLRAAGGPHATWSAPLSTVFRRRKEMFYADAGGLEMHAAATARLADMGVVVYPRVDAVADAEPR